MTKKAIGRPSKVNFRVMMKLSDAISHNYPVSDAVLHAKISRTTYYYHLNNDPVFAEIMTKAHDNKNKVSVDFRTTW